MGDNSFIDRTIEENRLKDLIKRFYIRDFSLYWNSHEPDSNLLTKNNFSSSYRKLVLLEYILKADKHNKEMEPILMISLDCSVTFKNVYKPEHEKQPRYKITINLKPLTITFNSDQIN